MNAGLLGIRVLVTRPQGQADALCAQIETAGGNALRFPAIQITELTPPSELLKSATAADWLIFTSKNAVDFAIKALSGKMPGGKQTKIAAIGLSTANALRQQGWQVDCVPDSEFSSEGLLAEPPLQQLAGLHCVIVRGLGGREKLAESLIERGATLSYLEVYQRCRPDAENAVLANWLADRQLDAVTVTSGEALQNLLALLNRELQALLKELPLIVVSDRIRQIAEQLSFKRIAVSRQATDAAILETLTTLFNGEKSGRTN